MSVNVLREINRHIVWVFLLALILVCSLVSPIFLGGTNVSNLVRQSTILGIVSLGEAVVIISGGIDLSVGSAIALASVVSAMTVVSSGSVLLAILASLSVCGGLGFVNGLMVTRLKLPPFIATFGMMGIARGCALTLTNGFSVPSVPASFNYLAKGDVGPVPVPGLILAGLFGVFAFAMSNFKFGRHIFAAGGDETAARCSGVNVEWVRTIVYTISGVTAGLAGAIYTARVETGLPIGAEGYEFYAITAALLGGVSFSGGNGSMAGVIGGAVILTIISNIMNLLTISPYVQGAAQSIVILIAIYPGLKETRWR